jgi:peptidoglycan/xylan/chitin deacetylase (PgdA/CDA1 family)
MMKELSRTRPDRFATLRLFYPIRRIIRFKRARIPILMYHSLSETGKSNTCAYFQTVTNPRTFAMHMKFLYESGYKTLGLGEAIRSLQGADQGSAKVVVITFDDGYRDFATKGLPILRQYGFCATMFLPTAFIGDSVRKFKGRECLTWSQVRDLHKAGIHFGSHTASHRQLVTIKHVEVEEEARRSKQSIEDKLGCRVESFSYPYAFPEMDNLFVGQLRRILEEAGYQNGVSTTLGTAGAHHDRYFLPRLPVNSWDDMPLFQAKLEGGYDWMRGPQFLTKAIKGIRPGSK